MRANRLTEILFDKLAVIGIFHRFGEEIPLNYVAAERLQTVEVFARFDAFLRGFDTEFFNHFYNALKKRLIAVFRNALFKEELIKFDFVDGNGFKNIVRRITRSEVVDRA